jgi:7-keto-8-aminopelargonate synthetase-like enzyme
MVHFIQTIKHTIMKKLSAQAELANRVVSQGRDLGMGHLKVQQVLDKGRAVMVNGKKLVSFSNCGYLGLEFQQELIEAAKEATDRYGTHFSSSRSFLELSIFEELEALLSEIFGKPTLYAQSTTLGHIAVIPTIMDAGDALILDHRAHNSLSNAALMVKAKGTHVEIIRHNNMEMLEARIQKLQDQYDRVWYLADGVYSMLGDTAPVSELHILMDKYEKFHVYYDDAHGMSWAGEKGVGFVLNKTIYHPKMVLITSLGKGFGTLGSALVLPDEETKTLVRNIGASLMFCIQPQPSTVAASIASAKLHLSNAIEEQQRKIRANISYFNLTALARRLPLASIENTPIFFMGVGSPEAAFAISRKAIDSGFYINSVVYPAVPHKNTGLRITVTASHTYSDIYELLSCISEEFNGMVRKKLVSREEITKAFQGAR